MGRHTPAQSLRQSTPKRRPGGLQPAPFLAAIALLVAIAAMATVRVDHRAETDSASQLAAARASASAASRTAELAAAADLRAESSAGALRAAVAAAIVATQRATDVSALTNLAAGLDPGAVSVAALNTSTGSSYQWGATGGMLTGSIVKLYILETLLLQEQNGGGLTSAQQATATTMIENSDNDSAESLFEQAGGRDALVAAGPALGLHNTVPGPSDYWGLTDTDAGDYITLLDNLVRPSGGPLTPSSQADVLGLMRNVESDQRWGVGVVADPGSDFANKDGWLSVDGDGGRWLVNSTGVLTIDGQQVLMVVLTQHDADFQSGIDLVQSIAQALVPLVVTT